MLRFGHENLFTGTHSTMMKHLSRFLDYCKWKWIDVQGAFHKPPGTSVIWLEDWRLAKHKYVLNDFGRKVQMGEYVLNEYSCVRDAESVLVFLGIAQSRSDAQRLIKPGGIQIREVWNPESRWTVLKLKQPIPEGVLLYIRRGKSMCGIKTIVLPRPDQKFLEWREILRRDNLPMQAQKV